MIAHYVLFPRLQYEPILCHEYWFNEELGFSRQPPPWHAVVSYTAMIGIAAW